MLRVKICMKTNLKQMRNEFEKRRIADRSPIVFCDQPQKKETLPLQVAENDFSPRNEKVLANSDI